MKLNLYIISTDNELHRQFQGIQLFENVKTLYSHETLKDLEGESVVLISDNILPYAELSNFAFNSSNIVFYMLQNRVESRLEKTVKAICDSRDIHLIPPRLTGNQIVEMIVQTIYPENEITNNVISFFSPIGNSGTTTTCLSVAMALKEQSKAKIGVLLLNAWDSGTDQLEYKGRYLDEIKSKLSGKLIASELELQSMFHMVEKNSLYVLAGNRSVKLERLFTKDEIHYLIEKSKEVFDIVLIDSGCHFDNANMVQALRESNLRFLILNQQMKGVKKFNEIYTEILQPIGYKKNDFLMILNDYENHPLFPNSKQIFNEVNIPMITTITKNKYGKIAEMENRSLYSFEDVSYQESINLIVKSISSFVDIPLELESKNKKKKLFGNWGA